MNTVISLDKRIESPMLIGRADAVSVFARAFDAVRAGRGQILVVEGEAGIGKSRLVAETRARALTKGFRIVQGNCFEPDRTLPYAPLLDLLRAFIDARSSQELVRDFGDTAPELVKLLPELATRFPAIAPLPLLDPEQEKRRLFQSLSDFFTRMGAISNPTGFAESPLEIIIEDLHWSDDTSLEFLLYLMRRIVQHPILLLLTYSRDEPHLALRHFLAELDRERLGTELSLVRLARQDVDAMVQGIFDLPHSMTKEFLDSLYGLTEGNPFFVEEILKALVASGEIYYENGVWERKPMNELRIPRSVQDAVARRAARLSDAARRTMTFAAVAGRRFDFALLQNLTGSDETELLSSIKELIAAQLVVEESAERYSFHHALTRQAIYSEMLARERKTLHRTIAETMERVYADSMNANLGDLAYHFYEAGAWAQALEYSRRAGDQAEQLYAHQEALSHYQRASRCAETLALPEQHAAIEEGIGDVYYARGEYPPAIQAYERALARAPSPAARAELKGKIGASYTWNADERGQEFLQAALNELNPETQANELARAMVWLGRIYWHRMQYTQSVEICERARRLAERIDDASTLTWVYRLLASTCSMLLRCDQAIEWSRECIALGERKAYPLAVELGYEMLSQSSALLGKWQDTLDSATRTRQVAEKIGRDVAVAWANYWRYWALHGQGDLNGAAAAARTALAQAQELSDSRLTIVTLAWLTLIETDLGAEGDIRAQAELALNRVDTLRDVQLQSECRRLLAQLFMLHEEWGQALELFNQCAALLRGTDSAFEMLLMGADHAESCVALGLLDEAGIIIARNLAIARDAHSRHYEAVARRVQGQIYTAREEWDAAERAYDEAITTLDETGSRLELARALYWRGMMWQRRRNSDAARKDLTHARELFQATGARPMLWRAHAALGRLAQAHKRHEEAEDEFAAARQVVEELAVNMADELTRNEFRQRANTLIPPMRPPQTRRVAKKEFGGLTERERRVASLVAQGMSNREIANDLVVSERTVESHVANILSKLGFTARTQIAAWAVEKGLMQQNHE